MTMVQDRADSFSAAGPQSQSAAAAAAANDDPVSHGLRESARRMIGIAVFSGVINLLMLSGSLYMLQVYDRVIPSRSIATLLGLSLMVLLAYLMQGYFDALRARMLCRVATLFDAGHPPCAAAQAPRHGIIARRCRRAGPFGHDRWTQAILNDTHLVCSPMSRYRWSEIN